MKSTKITSEHIVCQNPEQVAAEVDDEVLMMNINSGNYYSLNEVASFIWRQLATPMSVGVLCAAIQREFDVAPDTCEADVERFLDNMLADGMLMVVEAPQVTRNQVA